MDCNVIKRVSVYHMTRGPSLICWQLGANTFFKGRYWFFVDFGQPATDEWVTLNEIPIVDDCCYYDACQRNWGTIATQYYRVRLVLPDAPGCPVYKSAPVRAVGRLNRRQWLWMRKIISNEYAMLTKAGEGTQGFLLKRKQFGQACPNCLDWDTKEIRNPDCQTCYGTGIVGGYYPGVEHYVNFNAGWKRALNVGDKPRGVSGDVTKSGRCILYPFIDTKDVWVDVDSDERYIIRGWQTLSEIHGVPVIVSAEFRLAPATSIVYSIPIEPSGSSSSETPGAAVACDVSRGLDSQYEDW